MIAIIDFGMGNLGSVKRKMDILGRTSVITSDPHVIRESEKIVLPGVGHFSRAIYEIKKRGLFDVLSEQVIEIKKPVLGICLGMQLMAKFSEEGNAEGLSWIDSEVIRFQINDHLKYKIPHVGWNNAEIKKSSPLFSGIRNDASFYYVHSYHLKCNNEEDILTVTQYGYSFVSSIQKNNIFGTQFHPEKSHLSGELLLKNFINL